MKEISKCVSTIADECKRVGLEISTNSKREAMIFIIEDIVSTIGNNRLYVQND